MLKKLLFTTLLLTSVFGSNLFATETPKISASDYFANKENYQVLDVRSAAEFNDGHIAGAINVPHLEIDSHIQQLKAIKKPLVVHCRSGRRAITAEASLAKHGITNFVHLDGDIKGWKANNLPLVSNNKD